MKTPEELNALKNELEALYKKLAGLTEEELRHVSGGDGEPVTWMLKGTCPDCYHDVIAKVLTSGVCSCGARYCTGSCTMFTVDEHNTYLKSFINVEKYYA